MKKGCEVYFRKEAIYFISLDKTIPGIWIASEPMIKLNRDVSLRDLGEAVITAIQSSQQGVPMPDDSRAVTKAVLKFAGFKTWNAFAKGALCYDVEYDGMKVHITPQTSSGSGAFILTPIITG